MNKRKLNDLMNGRFSGKYTCSRNSIIIHCYEYVRSVFWKTILFGFISFVFAIILTIISFNKKWLPIEYPIIGFIVLCGIPLICYYVKKMTSIPCPLCGNTHTYYYNTKNDNFDISEEPKLEIECRNCHQRFETDCEFALLMSIPQKRDINIS